MSSKRKSGIIYSTNEDYFDDIEQETPESVDPSEQNIRVQRDRKLRKGKTVTLMTGFQDDMSVIKELSRELKTHCGSGGSYSEGEIIIQGDMVDKCSEFLVKRGYNVRKIGG